MPNLELQRKSLPKEPGVYLFKDKEDKIIYVGKAINIKKRVNQYFLKTSYNDPYYEEKIKELVKRIDSIDFIVTENEKEAFILENIQIKKHDPRFNAHMRDSKTYPWACIFYSEEFPRIRIIRGPEKYSKENLFLGPYTDRKEISRILRDLRKNFPYCSCKRKVRKRKRPCLYYQIKLCPGPCIDAIGKKEYLENIKKIEMFLKGETEELKNQIKKKMKKAAETQQFEIAGFWRDKLQAINNSTTQQNVLLESRENKDIIGYFRDSGQKYIAMVIIHVREGRIASKDQFIIDLREKVFLKEKIFYSLMEQFYYEIKLNLPDTIIVPELYEGFELFKVVLNDVKDIIQIRTPFNDELGLLRIANKNAKVLVEQEIEMEEIKKKEKDQIKSALESAKELLDLSNEPRIIEGFDISNIEGKSATGSMVYFLEGKPYNKNYRYYTIQSKSTPDDVAMMKEVINRRYTSILKRNGHLPDLILVDGGKGQLNAAVAVLKELGIEGIPVIGLAKKFEEIHVPWKKEPIILPRNSPLLKLFQRVRNEAHRFAVKLHKTQRLKRISGSLLDDIKGIGPATRNKLLKHFGSVNGVKNASLDELTQLIGKKLAETLIKNLK